MRVTRSALEVDAGPLHVRVYDTPVSGTDYLNLELDFFFCFGTEMKGLS